MADAMKRLVLFLDGTWNTADAAEPTNVQKLRKLVEAANRRAPPGITAQRIYYDEGVGTKGGARRWVEASLGIGVSENVREAYRFLSQFHEPGDEIFIFGYSRGAFTARSLAGFIAASGLLAKADCDAENLAFAWRYYRTPPKERMPADRARLERLGKSVKIRFLGVFDTVGALGLPVGWLGEVAGSRDRFHDTKLGSAIENAFHAMAIDERRFTFLPTLFTKPDHNNTHRVEQVWFPGSHGDVGGGCERSPEAARGAVTALQDVALAWMAERAASSGLDIESHHPVGPPLEAPHPAPRFYVFSQRRPGVRSIDMQPPVFPGRSLPDHFVYKVPPPDEPVGEAVHVSALDLVLQSGSTYRSVVLCGVLPMLVDGRIPIIDYDGKALSPEAAALKLAAVGAAIGRGSDPAQPFGAP